MPISKFSLTVAVGTAPPIETPSMLLPDRFSKVMSILLNLCEKVIGIASPVGVMPFATEATKSEEDVPPLWSRATVKVVGKFSE